MSMQTLQVTGPWEIIWTLNVSCHVLALLLCIQAALSPGAATYKLRQPLSTTESEYIALSQAMQEVIPFMNLMMEVGDIFTLHNPKPVFHCKVFEDNNSCIRVTESPKFTPRTKHIAIKYHHFRSFVADKTLAILPIDTKDQLADIFTKPRTRSYSHDWERVSLDYNCILYMVLLAALIQRECEDSDPYILVDPGVVYGLNLKRPGFTFL